MEKPSIVNLFHGDNFIVDDEFIPDLSDFNSYLKHLNDQKKDVLDEVDFLRWDNEENHNLDFFEENDIKLSLLSSLNIISSLIILGEKLLFERPFIWHEDSVPWEKNYRINTKQLASLFLFNLDEFVKSFYGMELSVLVANCMGDPHYNERTDIEIYSLEGIFSALNSVAIGKQISELVGGLVYHLKKVGEALRLEIAFVQLCELQLNPLFTNDTPLFFEMKVQNPYPAIFDSFQSYNLLYEVTKSKNLGRKDVVYGFLYYQMKDEGLILEKVEPRDYLWMVKEERGKEMKEIPRKDKIGKKYLSQYQLIKRQVFKLD